MGRRLHEILQTWNGGVVTTVKPDLLTPVTSPKGWNSALTWIAADQAVVSKRQGLSTMNATPITGSPAVIGQYLYKRRSGETLTSHHILVTDNGRMESLSGGTLTNLSTSLDSTSPNPPDFETANNLLFVVNGTDKVKYNGTAVQDFGIAAPSAPTVASGGVGGMTGTYEVALTYYNSATGQESSRSPVSSITLASEDLRVTIPNAADTQVDFVRIHIRKTTLSAFLFRVVAGTGINSTYQAWADNYGNVDLDLSDDDLNDLIILSPDEDENDPPPTGVKFLCWHLSRMFAADSSTVYYSKVGLPESFDPEFTELVNPDDGQVITGLHSAGGILLVFKSRGIYGIFGDDPNSWYVRQLDADTGCTSHRSILTIEGATYWWSIRGPMRLQDSTDGVINVPEAIGQILLEPTIDPTNLAVGQFSKVVAAASLPEQRVIFGVAENGQTRNTLILPFSYRAQRWEASKWDPMDPASLGMIEDSNGQPIMVLGGYAGQVFQMETGTNDGVPSGTDEGTFVAGSSSISTITSSGFVTTGGGLVERKVTIIDSDGAPVARRRITANTATVLTLDSAVTVTSGATYTFYVGGPDFRWETRWSHIEWPFHKKRFEYLFIQADSVASTNLDVDLAFDLDPSYGQSKRVALTGRSALWNYDMWTHSSYGTEELRHHRVRVGRTGMFWKAQFRQPEPDKPVTLRRVGIQAELQTTKTS